MIKKSDGKFKVVSKKGKPMGEYKTKKEAVKRIHQIEWFKHQDALTGGKK